jgi:protein-S-isoprenylcysteine O-methyltransferase Ste14
MSIKFGASFTEKGGWWVVAQVALFASILLALTRNIDPATSLQVVGWTLIGAAVLFAGSAMWLIRDKITAMPAPVDGAVLIERGPFSLVRHPIYAGVIVGFVGLSIKGGNIYAAALSLLLIPFFYAKTEHEERLLAARFPEYRQYRDRVRRRILPWIL